MSTAYRYTLRYGWKWIWEDLRWRHAPVVALRTFYWAILRGHDGETCQFCGRRYVLWHAPNSLWREIMGSSAGLSCPNCFDRRCERRGVWLHWQPELWEDYVARV